MSEMRLELNYRTECSNKFWVPTIHIDLENPKMVELEICFGKIGTAGQTRTKRYASFASALVKCDKLVCEKLAKGYRPTRELVQTLIPPVSSEPVAIASLYIGEHVPDEVVQDICGWATACLRYKMTPKKFESVWNKLMEEDEELTEALGKTGEEFWLDVTEWGEGYLSDLYATAVKGNGTHFVGFDNNSFIDIVALRGDPGAQAIKDFVLREQT